MTTKFGLDYFLVDVHFFNTKNARILKKTFGLEGVAIYFILLADIFENGYYIRLDESYLLDVADRFDIEQELIENVIRKLVLLGEFDKLFYTEYSVLTSVDIQNHFAIAKKKIPSLTKESFPFLLIDLINILDAKKYLPKRNRKNEGKQQNDANSNTEAMIINDYSTKSEEDHGSTGVCRCAAAVGRFGQTF